MHVRLLAPLAALFLLGGRPALAVPPPAPAAAEARAPSAPRVAGPAQHIGKVVTVPQTEGPPRTFRIEEHLASGYWSHAYKGVDTVSGERVVLKLMKARHVDKGTKDWFDKETGFATKAADPRLVQAYGVGTTEDGRRAMVMEFVEGSPVVARDKEGPPQPQVKSIQMGMQILRGARALERIGLHHNDLHPGNVVARGLDPASLKILDLGNAGARSTGTARYYNAPTHGAANDDVYSVGAIVIQLLTGTPSRDALPRIANPGLRAVLKKMTHPDPAERYQTAQEGLDALRPYAKDEPSSVLLEPRAVMSIYYGEESVALAKLGGLSGGAAGTSVEGHAGWAQWQAPEALQKELTKKLDQQMKPPNALSSHEALARHYADVALRTNATGAVLGSPGVESPSWQRHYEFAMRSSPREIRDEIVRRTGVAINVLGTMGR